MLLSGENTIDREELGASCLPEVCSCALAGKLKAPHLTDGVSLLVKQLLTDRPDFRFSRCQN